MTNIRKRPDWELPEREATPEAVFWRRREFLKAMGIVTVGAAGAGFGIGRLGAAGNAMMDEIAALPRLDVQRNPAYAVDQEITGEAIAARYNNFYEFSREKEDVWEHARNFKPRPWQVAVGGLVDKPRTYDIDDLVGRMPLEERVYRFRCVEAWSMVVPWTGFPLKALLAEVQPKADARYVQFTTFLDPKMAPRQGEESWYTSEPWPYTEGLTLAEANNELTLMAVGIYGHLLPKQHGAPMRLVVPWKYGFKNIKSITRIDLVREQPKTFWNTLVPNEYGFESNVNPAVPHPRWSQARERVIGSGRRQPTLPYNGYAAQVSSLYPDA